MQIIIEIHYFPCVAYFATLITSEKSVIDVGEHYQKQTYRNRCTIASVHKIQDLSIPIVHMPHKQATKDIKISYQENWVNVHWRSIRSAYGKAPFYEYYADFFEKILYKKPIYLIDLNIDILTTCLQLLGIKKNFEITEKYVNLEKNSSFIDFRSRIHPKKPLPENVYFESISYQQVFGNKFEHNMSILDLLFCEGSASLSLLQKSVLNKS